MRYPRTQRAIVEVISEAMEDAGLKAVDMNRLLKTNTQTMGRVLKLQQDLPTAWFIAIAKLVGLRPSTLMARVERRLRT